MLTGAPSFWGPSLWKVIHSIASNSIHKEQREDFKFFIYELINVLPCPLCCINLSNNLKILPIDNYLTSVEDLLYWTYKLHDLVNQEINKNPDKKPKWEHIKFFYLNPLVGTHLQILNIGDVQVLYYDLVRIGVKGNERSVPYTKKDNLSFYHCLIYCLSPTYRSLSLSDRTIFIQELHKDINNYKPPRKKWNRMYYEYI